MTTAARPTWAPAKGGSEQGGVRMFGPSQKFSSRDLASHTQLKLRYVLGEFSYAGCQMRPETEILLLAVRLGFLILEMSLCRFGSVTIERKVCEGFPI
jgi:hypothetical protein